MKELSYKTVLTLWRACIVAFLIGILSLIFYSLCGGEVFVYIAFALWSLSAIGMCITALVIS